MVTKRELCEKHAKAVVRLYPPATKCYVCSYEKRVAELEAENAKMLRYGLDLESENDSLRSDVAELEAALRKADGAHYTNLKRIAELEAALRALLPPKRVPRSALEKIQSYEPQSVRDARQLLGEEVDGGDL